MPDNLILDMVNNDAFGLVPLTQSISMIPNTYGRLNQLGLFPNKPVTAALVAVEINNGVLNIIPQQPRGGPTNQHQSGKGQMRYFRIPHFPLDDKITAEDLERVRAFGTSNQAITQAQLVARKQQEMAPKHFLTREFLANGALKGLVLDASGATILNIFGEFGVAEKVVDFALDVEGTNVDAKIREVQRYIDAVLLSDICEYVHCLCAADFFDNLVGHASIRQAYLNYQAANNPLRSNMSRGVLHQDVFFEVYPGNAKDAQGNTHEFIPAGTARFFPMGTHDTFATYVAPADFLETVNTEGLPMYSKLYYDLELQRWVGIHTQSNVLPICLRPSVLVKGTK
ncbi:MAG: major capsid protein [Desulfarculus sp.]|nr:major capsid protein [Desulfarculus sp.]